MSKLPLVSEIIPTYNRAHVIGKTIDDVFGQTYKKIEQIVVDDGSTDNTAEILSVYGDKIVVVRQNNSGPAAARNRGAAACHGDIIAFQDSDDFWDPTKLERQVRILDRAGPSVPCCLANMLLRDLHGDGRDHYSFAVSLVRPRYQEGIWLNVAEVLATRFIMFNQAAAIRRSAVERLGGFDESIKYLEDYDLPMRLAFEGPWAYVRDPLATWAGGGPDSFARSAKANGASLLDCFIRILERALVMAEQRGDSRVARQLNRRLTSSRRELETFNAGKSKSYPAQLGQQLTGYLRKYRAGLARRTPWYPKMKTVTIDAYCDGAHGHTPLFRGQEE